MSSGTFSKQGCGLYPRFQDQRLFFKQHLRQGSDGIRGTPVITRPTPPCVPTK